MENIKTYKQLFENTVEGKFPHLTLSKNFRDFLDYNYFTGVQSFRLVIYAVETDISFIDIGDSIDTITYLPFNKFELDDNPLKSKYRQKMKIGKFIKKLYDDNKTQITNSNRQIDDVVEIYKHHMESVLGEKNFKIVSGEDIRFWYLEDNYVDGVGSLNKSCMRQEDNQYRLDIYVYNDDKISMLILLDDKNKLLGRALLWQLNGGGIYMDRVYVVYDYHRITFAKYAEENNINITHETFIKKNLNDKLKVSLKNIDYSDDSEKYPYMDTFSYCYRNDHLLTNYYNGDKKTIVLDWN